MDNLPKEKGENIKCYVRCRPLNEHEKVLGIGCINLDKERNMICVENKSDSNSNLQNSSNLQSQFSNPRTENKNFSLDWVADESISQEHFYNYVANPILKSFFQGYNCTIFAYGQTGAGKSFTMLGSMDSIFEYNSTNHGLIPRIINSIFDHNKNRSFIINPEDDLDNFRDMKFEIKCSCLEIYQEQIIDLLNCSNNPHKESENLIIREDPKRGMYIEGIREEVIVNQRNALELIMLGLKNRHQAATYMNAESSRSHLIFTIFLSYSFSNKEGLITTRSSRLHLIDLAGSERQKATRAVGERIKEAGMINKSLSTLGNVINALVEFSDGKTKYVPFRDSKLTFFLKDSLGGNSKTTIIANISESIIQIQETLSTLKFVQRAKLIKNKATINENINATMKILQEEIKKLKDELEISKKAQSDLQNALNSTNSVDNTKNIITKKHSLNNNNQFISENCLSKKSPEDLEKSMFEIKREKMISEQTKQMNFLIAKIDTLINLQPQIEQKLKLFDDIYLDEFFEHKYKYEKNSQSILINLNEKMNHFTNILMLNENLLNDFKESIRIKGNKFDLDKIQKFLDELNIFKYDFELNSYLDIYKLEQENRSLRTELEIYKNISQLLQQNKLYSKVTQESLTYYNNIIKQFTEASKEIKEFFKQNLISKNGVKTLKEINLALIDQMTLDKMKFQIEEYKIQEDNKLKQIEELESENFLLNMEIMKYKSGNDFNLASNNNNIDNEDNLIQNNRKYDSETLDLGMNVYNSNFDVVEQGEGNKINLAQNAINNDIISNVNNNLNIKNLNINLNFNNANTFIGNKNDNDFNLNNKEISSPNKNINTNNNYIENLRNSISNQNSLRNSNMDFSSPQGNINNYPHTHRSTLSKENIEFLRLKEKLDNNLIELEEKNSEVNQKNSKIEELEGTIENLEKNFSINNITIKSLKDELDTLYDSNNILTMDIEKLNENQEKLKKSIDVEIPDIMKLVEINNNYLASINQEYKTSVSGFEKIYGNFASKANEMMKKLSSFLNDKSEKLESEEKTNKQLIKLYKENMWDVFENMTVSIKEFEKIIKTKISKVESKLNNFQDFIERAQILIEYKIKKQNNVFQSEIHRRILNILSKVGILSSKDDFDELLDNFEKHIGGKLFHYLNIDKNKLTKLERKILELKEEKKRLNNDIILLRTDFSDTLSSMALNNKIALLMKFKEENFKLRIEINQMRKKNDTLEKQMHKILDNNHLNNSVHTNFLSVTQTNNTVNSKFMPQSENNLNSLLHANSNNNFLFTLQNANNTSFVSNSGSTLQNSNHFEELNKIKKEYNELLEKIWELDENENTKNIYSGHTGQIKEKQAFRKALEILSKINENREYDKFFNKISFKNEMEVKNNILDSINNIQLHSENNITSNIINSNFSKNNLNKSIDKSLIKNNSNSNNCKKAVSNNQLMKTPPNVFKDDFRNKTPIKKKDEKLNSTFTGLNKTPKNSFGNTNIPTPNGKMNKTFFVEKKEVINNKTQKSFNDAIKKK